MTTNVLISSASRKVWLVEAFKSALTEEGGGRVIATDIDPLSAALYHSDIAYLVPKSNSDQFIEKMVELCTKESVDLVIPTRDGELEIFAENRDRFSEVGAEIMVSDPPAIEICSDKSKFIKWCQEHGFSTPRTYSYGEIEDDLSIFPLFVREKFGKGSKKAFKIGSKAELDRILDELDEPVIQEFVDEKEYTIDLFSDFDGRIISVIPRERISTFGGESFKGRTYKNSVLINTTVELARELELIGHNTIQCFFDGEEAKYIEVNPRFGGGANLGFAAGSLTPLYLIRILKGKELPEKIGDFIDGLVMLRYTKDVFIEDHKMEGIKRID